MTDLESILFMLPENEKQTVKAFLLMQQERIEKLEELVMNIQNDEWSNKWKITRLTLDNLKLIANKLYDKKYRVLHSLYHTSTNYLYIKFHGHRSKSYLLELLKNVGVEVQDDNIHTYDSEYCLGHSGFRQLWTLNNV